MLRKSKSHPDKDRLLALANEVFDPAMFHTVGELGLIDRLDVSSDRVAVVLRVPNADYAGKDPLIASFSAALARRATEGDRPYEVNISFEAMDDEERAALGERLRALDGPPPPPHTSAPQGAVERTSPFAARRSATRVLAISSGKGGVGKSSVTTNLAVAIAARGHSVGLLDADIYGYSVPRMMGVFYPPMVLGKTIIPPVAHGVRCMSMGFFVDEANAVAWRGPMLHKALEQFLVDVHWGAPEYLVVDMPPGTGDVALSIAQQLPTAELYVVTTPQPAAERVAQRAGALGKQLRLSVRGVIENMSWFETPDGNRHEIFGRGGGEVLAKALNAPLLAQIPLVQAVREAADEGMPAAIANPKSIVSEMFAELATRIIEMGPARVYRSELSIS